jgi:hypothetical protein
MNKPSLLCAQPDPAPTQARLSQQRSAATRRRNNLVRKKLKEQFPETDFELTHGGRFISWHLGPSEHDVEAAIASVRDNDGWPRILVRSEPCDCCGNPATPCERGILIPGLLVCLGCDISGRWRTMQPQPSAPPPQDDLSIPGFLRRGVP